MEHQSNARRRHEQHSKCVKTPVKFKKEKKSGMPIRPNDRTSYDLSDDISYIRVGQIVHEILKMCIGRLFNDQVREWPLQGKIDAAT